MITEDHVSFETAKLLKEKGFNEACVVFYDNGYNHALKFQRCCGPCWLCDNDSVVAINGICVAPTLQMAMKWLREVHNIHVVPKFDFYAGDYTGRIYDGRRESTAEKDDYIAIVGNNTYEQACEAGIKYCLENLI